MNLIKALNKTVKEERKELDKLDPITEATRLLEEKSSQDRELLRAMGIKNYDTLKKEELRGRKIELERAEKNANSDVYHIDEIKAIAIKYRLKFLKSDRYRGIIDTELPAKIREFCKAKEISMEPSQLQYRFYILAPYEAFFLDERPPVPKDPIMFYEVSRDYYQIVHQWGGDLTLTNRLKGFYYENSAHYNACNAIIAMMAVNVLCLILGLFGLYNFGVHILGLIIFPVVTFLITVRPPRHFIFTPQSWDSKDRT